MRPNGRLTGALLLIHLVCGLIVPYVFLLPLTAPPATFLELAAGKPTLIRLNVLMLLFAASLPLFISVMLARTFSIAHWNACAATIVLALASFVLQMVENTHWLTMLSASELYANHEGKEQLGLAAHIVRLDFKWAHYSHILLAVVWLLSLYALCFRTRAVPRTLAVVGMIACVLHVGGIVAPVFAGIVLPDAVLFGLPLALATVAMAGWLLVRGIGNESGQT